MELLVARTADVRGDLADLTDVERRRAEAFHDPADAADFVAAHLAAREVLRRLTHADRPVAQRCPECGSAEHGRPFVPGVPGVGLSWSHTRGVVAAVAAYGPVGVDVETHARPHDVALLLRRTATAGEAAAVLADADPALAYLRMWTAKEALVKVGVLSLARFREADVGAATFAGFDLTVTEQEDVVVGVAHRPPPSARD